MVIDPWIGGKKGEGCNHIHEEKNQKSESGDRGK